MDKELIRQAQETISFEEGYDISEENNEIEVEVTIRFGYMYKTVSVLVKVEK